MSMTITFTNAATQILPGEDDLDIHPIEDCDVRDFPHIFGSVDKSKVDDEGTFHYQAEPALDIEDIDIRWATFGDLQEEIAKHILGTTVEKITEDFEFWRGKPFVSIIDFPGSGTVMPPKAVKELAEDIATIRRRGDEPGLVEALREDYSDWMAGVYERFADAVEKVAERGGLVVIY